MEEFNSILSHNDPRSLSPLLGQINDPPKVLYSRGNISYLQTHKCLTVVGSRNYTPYGEQALSMLMSGLRGYPIVIISGLAYGVDTLAHKYALEYGLPTIAIPGSGLKDQVIYPRNNLGLAHNILHSGGGLLSEDAPDAKAMRWSFPRRNRIVAGVAHAILIVEASIKSGTLITARLGMEYNRNVLSIPGPITSSVSEGTNKLIVEGARPALTSIDILEELGIRPNEEPISNLELFDITEEERCVLACLDSPRSKGELTDLSKLPSFKLSIVISKLESKGLLKESVEGLIIRIR